MGDSPQLKEIYVRTDARYVVIQIDFQDDTHFEGRFRQNGNRAAIVRTLSGLLDKLVEAETEEKVYGPT